MISFVVMVVGAIHLSLAVLAATQVPVRTVGYHRTGQA